MAEYIEREALLRSLIELGYTICDKWNGIRDVILTEDSADVVPVVHGRWIDYHFVRVDCPKDGFPTVKCSKCEIAFCDLINNHHFMYHYCPNCGARMKDGE